MAAVAVRVQKRNQMGDLNVAQGDAPLVIVSASYRFSRWPVSRRIVRINDGFFRVPTPRPVGFTPISR